VAVAVLPQRIFRPVEVVLRPKNTGKYCFMFYLKKKNKVSRGFTLIELLVVIAIIGLLSSVVLASLDSARKKARVVRRLSDFRQIERALYMYYDTNGSYPLGTDGDNDGANWGTLKTALVPYINLPQDPLFDGSYPWCGRAYHYLSATGKNFRLAVCDENAYTVAYSPYNFCGPGYNGWYTPQGPWILLCG